jgi:hypothetical protein
MENYRNQVSSLSSNLDEKTRKVLQIDLLERLLDKVEPELNETLEQLIQNALNELKSITQEDGSKKDYLKAYRLLRKTVRNDLGYTAKGQLKEESIAMGIALGVAFGAAFLTFGVAFIGVGLPIGLAIGVAIGQSKEQEAEKNNKTY